MQAQTGAAAGTLGGKEWIEDFRQNFLRYSGAVILNAGKDAVGNFSETNRNAAGRANFADGLFGIAD
jgi:hypothetical protein